MTIAILDDNLLWSTRLKRTVEAFGHRAVVASPTTEVLPEADVAIVALSPGDPRLEEVLRLLRERGTHLIGHAGHKERDILASPAAGLCHQILTNSQAAFKLEAALALVDIRVSPPQS